MCDKTFDEYSIVLEFVPNWYKSKAMCDKIIFKSPFVLKFYPDKYVTQN